MRYLIRPAGPADDAGIRGLIDASPQPGRVLMNFERNPAFAHGSAVTCQQPAVWVAQAESGDIIAVFNIGSRQVFINGQPRSVRYAHDLRLAPDWRGSPLLIRLFRQLRQLLVDGEWMQTVILSENLASLNTVGSGRAGLPVYYPFGDIETSLLFAAPRRRTQYSVRRASEADRPSLQAWLAEQAPRRQFFPCYRLADLGRDDYYRGLGIEDYWLAWRGNRLCGVTALWDQKSFKQTRVLRYPAGLGAVRHAYNLWSRWRGGLHLPAAGGTLDYLMLHSTLIEEDDPAILDALLRPLLATANASRKALCAGFFLNDPLRAALDGYRRQRLASRHFLVSYDGDPRPELDQRLPYVEIARL